MHIKHGRGSEDDVSTLTIMPIPTAELDPFCSVRYAYFVGNSKYWYPW